MSVHYRNLDSQAIATPVPEESSLDRFFALLLQKRNGTGGSARRGVLIDPGHGGEDPGSIGLGGVKEKTLTMVV